MSKDQSQPRIGFDPKASHLLSLISPSDKHTSLNTKMSSNLEHLWDDGPTSKESADVRIEYTPSKAGLKNRTAAMAPPYNPPKPVSLPPQPPPEQALKEEVEEVKPLQQQSSPDIVHLTSIVKALSQEVVSLKQQLTSQQATQTFKPTEVEEHQMNAWMKTLKESQDSRNKVYYPPGYSANNAPTMNWAKPVHQPTQKAPVRDFNKIKNQLNVRSSPYHF